MNSNSQPVPSHVWKTGSLYRTDKSAQGKISEKKKKKKKKNLGKTGLLLLRGLAEDLNDNLFYDTKKNTNKTDRLLT